MCLERKRNERKMVQRLNGNEATGTSRVVIRHVHVRTHRSTHTPSLPILELRTAPPPPAKGSREQWGQGKQAN